MIEAYETDGWRGSARDLFKPTADLARAHRQVYPYGLLQFMPRRPFSTVLVRFMRFAACETRFETAKQG